MRSKEAINTVCDKFKDVNKNNLEKQDKEDKVNFPPKKRITEIVDNRITTGNESSQK